MDVVKIYSGLQMVVILSGTVIAYRGNPIEIVYGSSDKQLRLSFRFIDEEGVTESRLESNIQPSVEGLIQMLEFKLFNFKEQLGSGTQEPLEIAKLNGKRVFLHFRVYHLSGSDKTLHYSVYHETRPAPPQNVRVS